MTNDQITVSRALLQQAIDALSDTQTDGESPQWDIEKAAYDALRAALAEPVVEPVAEITGIDEFGPMLGWYTHWAQFPIGAKLYATNVRKPSQMLTEVRAMFAPQRTPAEPAVERVATLFGSLPVYDTPPAEVPLLTHGEVWAIWNGEIGVDEMNQQEAFKFAGLIEQAVRHSAGLK